jgi:uncharacterized membrane protein
METFLARSTIVVACLTCAIRAAHHAAISTPHPFGFESPWLHAFMALVWVIVGISAAIRGVP